MSSVFVYIYICIHMYIDTRRIFQVAVTSEFFEIGWNRVPDL